MAAHPMSISVQTAACYVVHQMLNHIVYRLHHELHEQRMENSILSNDNNFISIHHCHPRCCSSKMEKEVNNNKASNIFTESPISTTQVLVIASSSTHRDNNDNDDIEISKDQPWYIQMIQVLKHCTSLATLPASTQEMAEHALHVIQQCLGHE
jgi:hypothetical protein